MSFNSDVAVRTLWQECRGEPLVGQQAVAHVLWNRLRDGRWGNSLASVCLWRAQFSGWYMPHDPNFKGACELSDTDPKLGHLQQVLEEAHLQPDFTEGATHYYATYISEPAWVKGATFCGEFGRQRFYKDVK